jgi:hypothetical protein
MTDATNAEDASRIYIAELSEVAPGLAAMDLAGAAAPR